MPTAKPKLEKLSTPITAAFPSEIASATTATPLSALAFPSKTEPDFVKTPISPPSAYTDFLSKAMAFNPPSVASGESSPDLAESVPESESTASSSATDESSPTSTTSRKPSPSMTMPAASTNPLPSAAPRSAPLAGPVASFPSLRLPPSPAVSHLDSPLSASIVRSPFSARSVHSAFDWDAALKARISDKQKSPGTSIRHFREVVTRTVTYTPRMEPAPRGKRRKME